MIGAFLIVLRFLKNSYRPVSDMTFLTDIYLRLKIIEHKWGIGYFVICAKAGWCYRLEVLLFKIQSASHQWFKKLSSEIYEVSLFSKLILLTNLEDLNKILMFLFGEIYFQNTLILAKIWEILIQVCESTFCFLQPTQINRLIWGQPYLKTKVHYFRNLFTQNLWG